jgi:hypothetical protein
MKLTVVGRKAYESRTDTSGWGGNHWPAGRSGCEIMIAGDNNGAISAVSIDKHDEGNPPY